MFFFQRKPDDEKQPKSSPHARHPRRGTGRPQFRPQLEGLEDRMVPSSLPLFNFPQPYSSGPATQLEVILPENSQVGIPEPVQVIALGASNQRVFNFTGIIAITASDPNAILPANYTFTAKDHGAATFKATFESTGTQSVTATDAATASISGSASTLVNPAPIATHFLVVAPSTADTGQQVTVTIVALDASNHKVPNYTGTVQFGSTDSAAILPANATLTKGTGTFSATLNTVGSQTVSATDTVNSSLTGKATIQVSAPGVAVKLEVFAFPVAGSGKSFEVYVAALDGAGKLATSFTDTVQFTSSDTAATLPGSSTLTGGKGTFSVTLSAKGAQTITVTDSSDPSLTATTTVYVLPPWFFGGFGRFG